MPQSDIEYKFLQLLHSSNEESVALALEMSKGMPELNIKKRMEDYLTLYQVFYNSSVEQMEPHHLVQLELGEAKPDLRCGGLSYLPPEIKWWQNARELNLKHNQLKRIPAEIGQLTNLTRLNLKHNQLEALPPETGKLHSLTELNLSYNSLTSLLKEAGKLAKLKRFNLEYNQLTVLPAEIGQLKGLQSLNLGCNQLTALPAEIGLLENLHFLDLRGNRIANLPKEMKQLKKLRFMYMSDYSFFMRQQSTLRKWLPQCHVHFYIEHPLKVFFARFMTWLFRPVAKKINGHYRH